MDSPRTEVPVTLRDLVDERDRRYQERFAAQEQALQVALTAQKAHDERANGLVDKLADQYKEFIKSSISRPEYDQRHASLEEKIEDHSNATDQRFVAIDVRLRGIERTIWLASGAVMVIAGLFEWLLKKA